MKRDDGGVRRAAPPPPPPSRHPVSRSLVEHGIREAGAVGSNPLTRLPRPADGPNPFARRQWLKTLNTFIGERLKGRLQWAGWEVVAKALNGDSLAPDEKRRLDGLDRMMRGCGYRDQDARHEQRPSRAPDAATAAPREGDTAVVPVARCQGLPPLSP
jgi:hypothetical protein